MGSEQRLMLTTNQQEPSLHNIDENSNIIAKMRDLRARSPYSYYVKDHYEEAKKHNPSKIIIHHHKEIKR